MQGFIIHNSQEERYRKPFGAVACGSRITLRLEVETDKRIDCVELYRMLDGVSSERQTMEPEGAAGGARRTYAAEFEAPGSPGLIWYYFEIRLADEVYYCGNNPEQLGGLGEIYKATPPFFQITVYRQGAATPAWFKEAVMYQIFVDRFYNGSKDGRVLNPKKNSMIYANWDDRPAYIKDCDTNAIMRWDFFGGNLPGVIEKLEYLKELGINVIYLNPVFESPSNHKYDTADYKNIDPMFGGNEAFEALCRKAADMGIAIILDGVFSHTGSDSKYFNKYGTYSSIGAYQSQSSPYYSWYRFKGSPDSYDCWWGVDTLPNVNEMDPGYIKYIIEAEDSVLNHWMGMGVKGWRLDVADELPDEFIASYKAGMAKRDADSVLIGEVWEDASNKISYGARRKYLLGDELDSVMNYPFRSILLDFMLGASDAHFVHRALMSLYENYPLHIFYSCMNLIGSHDVPRILTLLGNAPPEEAMKQREKEDYRLPEEQLRMGVGRLKLMSLLQMTFPGVPCIYYGDEAGVEGYRDPLNRCTYPWGKENRELLEWYGKIIGIRRKYSVFGTGQWIPVYADRDVFGYIRRAAEGKDVFGKPMEDNTAVVLVNRDRDRSSRVKMDLGSWYKGTLFDILNGCTELCLADGMLDMELKPLEGKILLQKV